jgi:hypothetical protein
VRHSALLLDLKVHCNLIRTRFAARLAVVRSQTAKAAKVADLLIRVG